METAPVYYKKQLVWTNILFFGLTTLISFTGLPLYAYFVGLTSADWALFFFMAAATMMATTFGYHRLFAHRAFKAHPIVVFLNLFFGAAAFENSAITWASQHRDHHRFTDTERDPYNIKNGFWYAHMGWFLFRAHNVDYDNAKDLSADPMVKTQHDQWIFWAIAGGFVLPLMIGLFTGHFWGAFFLGVCGRFFIVHQSVFLINSACHMFGRATYDEAQTAKDSWVCALLTNGEGYHNYHHSFPNDYRNGVRWYHWDPTKWAIRLLSFFGLTYDLKKTPEVLIHEAHIEQQRDDLITAFKKQEHPYLKEALHTLTVNYERARASLKSWEAAFAEYKRLRGEASASHMEEALARTQTARRNFFKARRQWIEFVNRSLEPVS